MPIQNRCAKPLALMIAALAVTAASAAETREEKVRRDREKVEGEGFWLYNDLPAAFEQAEQTGKPIIVVLRCIPCEECVKLDDDLVDRHPVIRPLLERFVRVRQVSTNGLDLNLFQFDTDQSFAVFLLNADGTVYGRFGTRSHRTEWYGDVSLEGLAKALQAALDLHEQYPGNRSALAGKRGEPAEVDSPEAYPALKEKYTSRLDYEGNVVRSCIHCHQIGDAQRSWYRDAGKTIPEAVLFPYPHPKVIGLTLDPHEKAEVKSVEPNSIASRAGLRAGDEIRRLDGQPLLSIADVQWVLHRLPPEGGELTARIRRGGTRLDRTLTFDAGWRRGGDLSWRASSWGLRRMVTGGMKLEAATKRERSELGVEADSMALAVRHLGQYGPHAAAKRAGFREGDVIVAYDRRRDLMTESALLHHGATQTRPGDQVDVTVVRDGTPRTLPLPMQQ